MFLTALLGERLPEGLWAHVWHRADKRADWVQTPAEAEASASRNGRRDVYLGVGLAGTPGRPDARVTSATAVGLLSLGVDVDVAGPAHQHAALPPDDDAALALLEELGVEPTLVIYTGHGIQAQWVLSAPWRFPNAADKQQAMRLCRA